MPADHPAPAPAPGQIWRNKRTGKRRIVWMTTKALGDAWPAEVRWIADGPNHGQNSGSMLLRGWLASFVLEREAPDAQ